MLENLEKTVGITPKNLVEANRDESAPLHNEFEWNDTKAAEKYRETQAGYIIRNICVVRKRRETARQSVLFRYNRRRTQIRKSECDYKK